MKNTIKNKNGAAIETAIIMLMVVFGLCTLIVTASLMIRKINLTENMNVASTVVVDSIGEEFIKAVRYDMIDKFKPSNERFTSKILTIGNEYTMTLTEKENNKLAFIVSVIKTDEGDCVITSWHYTKE